MKMIGLQWLNPVWLNQTIFTLYGGGGKGGDAPAAPDYTAAAQATAQGNLEAARVAAKANRVSQYTPYGNLIYSQVNQPKFDQSGYDSAYQNYQKQLQAYNSQPVNNNSFYGGAGPFGSTYNTQSTRGPAPIAPTRDQFTTSADPDVWQATQTLSPAEQAKLDQNNQLALGFLNTANKGLKGVDEAISQGFDFNALPAQQINAGQTAQDAIYARLNPQFDRRQAQLETQLANQGIARGTEAYTNAQSDLNNARNDAYTQAALQGIDVGQRARQQALQEQEFGRTEGLNIINALRTGNQVQNPNFVNAPLQQTTAGADLLGAANQQYGQQLGAYNAQQAQGGNFLGGLMNIGGQLGSAYLMSDERLKSNIKRIGTHDKLGVGIYSYEKFGKPEVGVMAQEVQKVKPDAVHTHESGYLMVDYGKL